MKVFVCIYVYVIIPIKDRSKETLSAYRTNNRTTVIDITKYKETESFVCKFCSVTLKSLNKLEKHKEQMHGHGKDKLFYRRDIKILCMSEIKLCL